MLHFEDTFTVWNAYGKNFVVDINTTQGGKEYAIVSVTSSSKNKLTDKYDTDWKGQIKFYGNALDKIRALGLVEKDRIKVKGTEQNIGIDGKFTKYTNIVGWEVEKVANEKKTTPSEPILITEIEPLDISEDQLPF